MKTTDISVKETELIFLGGGRCNAEDELPLAFLVRSMIDLASIHANKLGFGFDRLIKDNCSWVLSRLAVEMNRWPRINETFRLTTWIVDSNRMFSDRAFLVENEAGDILGYGLTSWMAINLETRKPANLNNLIPEGLPDMGFAPPIAPFTRHTSPADDAQHNSYTFAYTDIDCNRHVTTGRYIELLLNQFDMDFFDTYRIVRFETAFHAEARCGETVDVASSIADNSVVFEIQRDGKPLNRALMSIEKR